MRKYLGSICLGVIVALLAFIAVPAIGVMAATTADVAVNATPAYVSISVSPTTYGFGVVQTSSTTNTTTTYFTIDNTSTVSTNQTISVTASAWAGGVTWTHSDTCTPGVDTVGLKSNKGGTWGTGDVIVKYSSPNNIAANQVADTDYSFGLSLHAPTSFGDGVLKTNTVRITATA